MFVVCATARPKKKARKEANSNTARPMLGIESFIIRLLNQLRVKTLEPQGRGGE